MGISNTLKSTALSWARSPILTILISTLIMAGCGRQDDNASRSGDETSTLSLQTPDAILGSRLDLDNGELFASLTVNGGDPIEMDITERTATKPISNLPTGSTTFAIVFTYETADYGLLTVARAEKTVNITAGDNSVEFFASDYDTASYDEDGDGISNIVELDDTSTSSPIVEICILDSSNLDQCELGA